MYNQLIKNPGVISITIYPAMTRMTRREKIIAKNSPGYVSTPVRIK